MLLVNTMKTLEFIKLRFWSPEQRKSNSDTPFRPHIVLKSSVFCTTRVARENYTGKLQAGKQKQISIVPIQTYLSTSYGATGQTTQ